MKKTGNEINDFEKDDEEIIRVLFDIFHRKKLNNNVYGKDLLKWSGI